MSVFSVMEHLPPFESTVAAHGATVLRVCRAVVGHDDADDAWSETFLAALKAYPSLATGSNIEAWLVTIAHRKSLDILRARARRPIPVAEMADAPSPDHRSDAFHDLWPLVARLPLKQRQAVAYHYIVGLPHPQIAEIVGATPAAVRRAASDGIAALRRARRDARSESGPQPPREKGRS
ncbi:RNA polymerase sigma factor [Salinibacterium hongtaonis]|uniref:RNA polymerase sigma factor n=1 Tax=Homoserinimonas hongtaonis TaxID=2079791 RepID=UPI0030D02E56